jgi:hypothetical protein
MKDFAGNELEIGQKVVCLTTGRRIVPKMIFAKVIGFTAKKVQVEIKRSWGIEQTVREPNNVVVSMTPEVQDQIQADILRANLTSDFPDPDFPLWD